jgi:hypothetical protein
MNRLCALRIPNSESIPRGKNIDGTQCEDLSANRRPASCRAALLLWDAVYRLSLWACVHSLCLFRFRCDRRRRFMIASRRSFAQAR